MDMIIMNDKELKEYRKNYYRNNKEDIQKKAKIWRDEHKKENSERIKNWRKKNPDKVNRNALRYYKKEATKVKVEIYKLLGGQCVNPYNLNHGEFLTDIRCLQIDHVKGNGRQERERFSNYTEMTKYILKEIKAGSKDYQLLCSNCNWIKRHKNKESPHYSI